MSENESKKHGASQRKLNKQREQGSIASSADSSGMLATAAGLITFVVLSGAIWVTLREFIVQMILNINLPFEESYRVGLGALLRTISVSLQVVVGIVISVGLLAGLILNKGVVFAMKPVTPDLKRVSPVAGAKRVFGKRGFMETLAATIRLSIWTAASIVIFGLFVPNLFVSTTCDIACLFNMSQPVFMILIYIALGCLLVFSIADIVLQRRTFMEEQKMTDTELKRERKDQSQSPEVAKERNRRRGLLALAPKVPLRVEDTTILFWGEKGYIGINFDPPKQELPLVCAKARHGSEADELRKKMAALGVPIMESDGIVADCMGKGMEEHLDPSQFAAFAMALASR